MIKDWQKFEIESYHFLEKHYQDKIFRLIGGSDSTNGDIEFDKNN